MYLVGLTGGIATGKSTVSAMLSDLGCPIVDADLIAREVVEPGMPASIQIRKVFGDDVFHSDGTLNRERLGQIIFSDAAKRKQLNQITHPEIYKTMLKRIFLYFIAGHQFVILDLPLLFETGKVVPYLSSIIVVSCDAETQLQRLMARNNYTEEEAKQRIQAQMSLTTKCERATHVILNSGPISATQEQVNKIYEDLKSSWAHWKIRLIVLSLLGGLACGGTWIVKSLFV